VRALLASPLGFLIWPAPAVGFLTIAALGGVVAAAGSPTGSTPAPSCAGSQPRSWCSRWPWSLRTFRPSS